MSVLSNLVRNAVKYIGDGSDDPSGGARRVAIRPLLGSGVVRVEVEDHRGRDFSPELAEHVFEPAVRAPQ